MTKLVFGSSLPLPAKPAQFRTIAEVWEAVDAGKRVYWSNDAYALTVEPVNREWRERNGFEIPFSAKGAVCLRVTCLSNWFGSLLIETELGALYTK